jgi:hypothetical protein
MSEKEQADTDETPGEEEQGDEIAPEDSESEEAHISFFIGDFGRASADRVSNFDLSALSYITCDKCKGTYIKGDEHECP